MNKIVSYSLWGNSPKYTVGAIKNAEQVNKFYPGWISRFYCGKSVPSNIILDLKSIPNTEIIQMEDEGDWKSMFWRFYSADSDDICISRDTDSRITQREVDAVNAWLNSDKDFHIMRDHPWHGHVILGGMWGSRNGILKGLVEQINSYDQQNRYMTDQDFLKEKIYFKVRDHAMVHDPFFEKKPFPTERQPREFVGKPFDENDNECDKLHSDLI